MAQSFENVGKIPELRNRILYTLLMFIIFRLGVHITTPGVNAVALSAFFNKANSNLFGMFNMFTGGALSRFSIFSLGIMPYISSSIIFQMLPMVFPSMDRLQKEGEAGRKRLMQYIRYGTVGLALLQSIGISYGIQAMKSPNGIPIVSNPGLSFMIISVITLTAGTVFVMWIGEEISENGIGNGISLIIFAGIVAALPAAAINTFKLVGAGELSPMLLVLVVIMMALVIGFIVFVESAQRRIPIQYPKKMVGRKLYSGQVSYLPIKVNTAGVIPPIFAMSILLFPATISNFIKDPFFESVSQYLNPEGFLYNLIFVILIFFFCYFYTAITFKVDEVSDDLRKYGGNIPGIKPGKSTANFIDKILNRVTFIGAVYLSAICLLPTILIDKFHVPFYFGGTGLLIVVVVAMDTIVQIQSHLLYRNYDSLLKKASKKK
ncbi:MAG: preprotein translocase subunit SecY [Deltaproteobacteria bacterium]|nr:preprotein translocase subunit SecY [Deltaproteobacteria bacterium]